MSAQTYPATIPRALSQAEGKPPNLLSFLERCFSLPWTPDHLLRSCSFSTESWGVLGGYHHTSSPSFRGTLEINLRQHFWVMSTRKWLSFSPASPDRALPAACRQVVQMVHAILPTLHPTQGLARTTNSLWYLDLAGVRWPYFTFCVGNSAHACWEMSRQCMIWLLLVVGFSKAANTGSTLLAFSNTKVFKSIIFFL